MSVYLPDIEFNVANSNVNYCYFQKITKQKPPNFA